MRAALPFRSRRKYSLARRTLAPRRISILSTVGECNGKMRSTPWPNDTLRTVNVARAPPRCIPITMPSKTWMRSLSPSRTFTWTRTVSPARMSGRFVRCVCSIVSIAFITVLLGRPWRPPVFEVFPPRVQPLAIRRVQVGAGQQIRPPRQRAAQPFAPPPFVDLGMMPREEHLRHRLAAPHRRPGVVRVIEQPAAERIRRHRRRVPDYAGHEPHHRVEHDQRGQLAARQPVIADRQLVGHERGGDSFIDAFVPPADNRDAVQPADPLRLALIEPPPLRRHQDHRRQVAARRANRLDRAPDRLRLHDHARPAAERHIVHRPVPIVGERPKIPRAHLDESRLASPRDNAFGERRLNQLREDRDDVNRAHHDRRFRLIRPSRGVTSIRFAPTSTRRQMPSTSGISTSPPSPSSTTSSGALDPKSTRRTGPTSSPVVVTTWHPSS